MTAKYKTGSGDICAVTDCSNSRKKLFLWDNSECNECDTYWQSRILHKDCACTRPFRLHKLPTNEDKRREWIKALNREKLPKRICVCSEHFIDGKPTPSDPTPKLKLGYVTPDVIECRKLPTNRQVRKRKIQLDLPDEGNQPPDTSNELPQNINLPHVFPTEKPIMMPSYCFVPLCTNKIGGHRFPTNAEMKNKWINAIKRNKAPTPASIVCHRHFQPSDYRETLMGERKRLLPTAVPSVFSCRQEEFPTSAKRCANITLPTQRTDDEALHHCTSTSSNRPTEHPIKMESCTGMLAVPSDLGTYDVAKQGFQPVVKPDPDGYEDASGTPGTDPYPVSLHENKMTTGLSNTSTKTSCGLDHPISNQISQDGKVFNPETILNLFNNCKPELSMDQLPIKAETEDTLENKCHPGTPDKRIIKEEPMDYSDNVLKTETSLAMDHMDEHEDRVMEFPDDKVKTEDQDKVNSYSNIDIEDPANNSQQIDDQTPDQTQNGLRENILECTVSSNSFSDSSYSVIRNPNHAGKHLYQCNKCCKYFLSSDSIKKHSLVHNGEKPLECGFCKKRYSCVPLSRHMKVHTGKQWDTCPVCFMKFSTTNKLANHSLMHSSEELFECVTCAKIFANDTLLAEHRTVHSEGKLRFWCRDCGKSFSHAHKLVLHKRDEKPLTCDV